MTLLSKAFFTECGMFNDDVVLQMVLVLATPTLHLLTMDTYLPATQDYPTFSWLCGKVPLQVNVYNKLNYNKSIWQLIYL